MKLVMSIINKLVFLHLMYKTVADLAI